MTELFYKYLSGGLPVDVALQKAKLEFIGSSRENRLPYYWAAAIVAGKTDIIYSKKTISWKPIALATGAFGILLFSLAWRRRKRKKSNGGILKRNED